MRIKKVKNFACNKTNTSDKLLKRKQAFVVSSLLNKSERATPLFAYVARDNLAPA